MAFGSFFTRALDIITPWRRGGEVQRDQERRKRREEEEAQRRAQSYGYSNNRPTVYSQNQSNDLQVQPLKPQKPINIFEDLNKNLVFNKPQTTVPVAKNQNLQVVTPPKPGTIVQPNNQPQQRITRVTTAPDQAIRVGNKLIRRDPNAQVQKDLRGIEIDKWNKTGLLGRLGRATAGTAVNFGGGLVGAARGVVELPSLAANVPNLFRLGTAKVTHNENAAEGARRAIATNPVSNAYSRFVNPVSNFLARTERNTDELSQRLVPTQTNTTKNLPKVAANLLPIEAIIAGLARTGRFARGAEETAGITGTVGEGTRALDQLSNKIRIPVRQNIPIEGAVSEVSNIPIRTTPRPQGQIIRELGGDAPNVTRVPTPEEVATQKAADRFSNQDSGRSDQRIEGVTARTPEKPFALEEGVVARDQDGLIDQYATMLRDLGEGNGVAITPDGRRVSNNVRFGDTGGKRMTKAMWREEAERQLRSGKADPSIQKVFDEAADPEVQALLAKGERPEAPEGRPITVKQVNGINVIDNTDVPQNLPETPGTVRATTQTSPMQTKSEAVAAQIPVALPKEVQAVLDNPKQFNKRQVAAARNQRKLAKQLAKTKSETQSVIDDMPELAPTPDSGTPGFVPTGEFRRGENGNISEVAHRDAEAAQAASDTATMSAGEALTRATNDIAQNGVVSPESVRNLQSMLESGRFTQTSPEYRAIAKTLYGAGSDYGRGLSLFNPTLRRTATGDQLANRFISKLYGVTEDASKLTDSDVAIVSKAANDFTNARDTTNQLLDRYNVTKSPEDFNAWKQARQVADEAEKHSLITEYRVASKVLKGNKDPNALKAIQDAEKKAGVYQMDWIDSSMLSGTGTFTRNLVNTSLVRLENATFGRLPGGGRYSGRGARIGNKLGNRSVVSDFKARSELDQNKLSKTVKQWSTTGNTLGEGNIKAVGSARAYRYYSNQLKSQGISGGQLKRDTEVMLHSDPDGMAKHYEEWALRENALSSMAHSKKIEQSMVDAIASKGGGKLSQTAAKAIVRLTVGFPTVIGRSLLGGAKRATVGVPELLGAGVKLAKGDKQAAADLLYNAKVHAGSGASLYALGTVLASAGIISPSYPTDPAEKARWKAEGIQPNSIKIGGQWFNIPGYFGALALPLVIPANVMNETTPEGIAKGVIDGVQDLSPTTGIQNFIDGVEGRGGKQWVKNEVASLTRAVTPVGSLLNQIAKMTDDTKNDTTTKDGIHNILDAIAAGIPGVNNAVNTIPATDDNGNVLHNPNPVAIALGAQGSEQKQGVEDNKQAQGDANNAYKQLVDYGVLKDKTLVGLIDPKIQAQIKRGEDLTPEQVKDVQKAVVKGVSESGTDTAYLEKEQYDANLAVLKVKRDLLASDPTVKPSSLKDLDTAITRGEIYKNNEIPYDLISAYKETGVTEWRNMGDPESDEYDPEMYEKLFNIDKMLADKKVSYKKGSLDKPKYFLKAKKGGKGGRGSRGGVRQIDTSFGTLKAGTGAPNVQQYVSIDAKAGAIPHISVKRPNIVHKITSG